MYATGKWTSVLAAIAAAQLAASSALATNTALLAILRIDDFLYPSKQFAMDLELELDVAEVSSVAVTVGGIGFGLEFSDGSWSLEDVVFDDLAAMKTALGGLWTIEIAGSSPSISTFTLDAASFGESDFFATATGLSPANGEVDVDPGTLLSWNDPTGDATPYVLGVGVDSDFGSEEVLSLKGEIDVGATSWQPSEPLPKGANEFWASYADVDSSFITPLWVSSGSIVWSSHEFSPPGYPAATSLLALGSETIVSFTVPEPSAALLSAVALGVLAVLAQRRRRRA